MKTLSFGEAVFTETRRHSRLRRSPAEEGRMFAESFFGARERGPRGEAALHGWAFGACLLKRVSAFALGASKS